MALNAVKAVQAGEDRYGASCAAHLSRGRRGGWF